MNRATIPPTSSYHRWVGIFTRLEVLLTVKGYLEDKTFRLFDVDNASQCSRELAIDYPCVVEHKVSVIGYVDCKWYIHLPIEDVKSHW